MTKRKVRVIECFEIPGLGLLTELQHIENGIPPNSQIIDLETNESWIVKKRVYHGILILNELEKYFECETASIHIDSVFQKQLDREIAIEKELAKREKGIYYYLLAPENKRQRKKPKTGIELKINCTNENKNRKRS
ncbi:hypothetical protein F7018_17010 [Tenacibaculum aiptasiae]|uniref:Uncharacterized protein n=1 Tax=Tenacibaculum aiptasiae TaxID=426481 RepID=A0A7J5A797_9FLAO|nr:hypothetical protein [Tenacibaculum aiptasiae]KAB1153367.1 hypothetical protein F7018_17010 [Tenacibaculum aiptasiae]